MEKLLNGLKAYHVTTVSSWYSTIVFAESRDHAKALALRTDCCEDEEYINIRVNRFPQADCLYKGNYEIDWYDEDTRIALVRDFGWSCYEAEDYECRACPAKNYCDTYKQYVEELT